MWTLHTDRGNNVYGGQFAKNIYLGETRIVTKLSGRNETTIHEEYYKQYYYHSDHLGSASLISDYKGDEYQRIEYAPYGETWVEKTQNTGLEYLLYKFTAKEQDEETGLYYYGARYLDAKYSRWLSADPAVSEYMSGTSAGEGGIYNTSIAICTTTRGTIRLNIQTRMEMNFLSDMYGLGVVHAAGMIMRHKLEPDIMSGWTVLLSHYSIYNTQKLVWAIT